MQDLFPRKSIERRIAGGKEGQLVNFMYRIGDFLIQIKNAYRAHHKEMEYPHSNVVAGIAQILEKEGYIGKISNFQFPISNEKGSKEKKGRKMIRIELKYEGRVPALTDVKLVSRPSVHHYLDKSGLKKGGSRHGISILSTSQGIMTGREAQKKGVGGELICQIF